MAKRLRAESASKLRSKAANTAAKKTGLEPAAIPQESPMGQPAALSYYWEGNRILRCLRSKILSDNGPDADLAGPDSEDALKAMFALAVSATLNCAEVASQNEKGRALAQRVVEGMDCIAVLRGNPSILWPFEKLRKGLEELERLSTKTFQTYHSRSPHKKTEGDSEKQIRLWVIDRMSMFWRGVITRERCDPPIPDEVRMSLLSPENRLNGRKWALALFNSLPKRNGIPVEVSGEYGYKLEEKFFKAFSPKGRLDDTKQGFASYVGKRFNPLLRSEVKHAETAYNILMSERMT
jgi:hypothetical protein